MHDFKENSNLGSQKRWILFLFLVTLSSSMCDSRLITLLKDDPTDQGQGQGDQDEGDRVDQVHVQTDIVHRRPEKVIRYCGARLQVIIEETCRKFARKTANYTPAEPKEISPYRTVFESDNQPKSYDVSKFLTRVKRQNGVITQCCYVGCPESSLLRYCGQQTRATTSNIRQPEEATTGSPAEEIEILRNDLPKDPLQDQLTRLRLTKLRQLQQPTATTTTTQKPLTYIMPFMTRILKDNQMVHSGQIESTGQSPISYTTPGNNGNYIRSNQPLQNHQNLRNHHNFQNHRQNPQAAEVGQDEEHNQNYIRQERPSTRSRLTNFLGPELAQNQNHQQQSHLINIGPYRNRSPMANYFGSPGQVDQGLLVQSGKSRNPPSSDETYKDYMESIEEESIGSNYRRKIGLNQQNVGRSNGIAQQQQQGDLNRNKLYNLINPSVDVVGGGGQMYPNQHQQTQAQDQGRKIFLGTERPPNPVSV